MVSDEKQDAQNVYNFGLPVSKPRLRHCNNVVIYQQSAISQFWHTLLSGKSKFSLPVKTYGYHQKLLSRPGLKTLKYAPILLYGSDISLHHALSIFRKAAAILYQIALKQVIISLIHSFRPLVAKTLKYAVLR